MKMFEVIFTTKQQPLTNRTMLVVALDTLAAGDKVVSFNGNDLCKIVSVSKVGSGMFLLG